MKQVLVAVALLALASSGSAKPLETTAAAAPAETTTAEPVPKLYVDAEDIVHLTTDNFKTLVTDSNDVWVVQFYAPWCRHCRKFVGEFSKAATALKGIAKVGVVDATDGANQPLFRKYKIDGFPTVLIFHKYEEYDGRRKAEDIVSAVKKVSEAVAEDTSASKTAI